MLIVRGGGDGDGDGGGGAKEGISFMQEPAYT